MPGCLKKEIENINLYILRNFKLETRFGMKPAASAWMIMFWGIN